MSISWTKLVTCITTVQFSNSAKLAFIIVYMCALVLSFIQLFATPWTVAHQAPLSLGFSRQEYWNGLPFPPPGNLPNPGIESTSLTYPALAGTFFFYHCTTWETHYLYNSLILFSFVKYSMMSFLKHLLTWLSNSVYECTLNLVFISLQSPLNWSASSALFKFFMISTF